MKPCTVGNRHKWVFLANRMVRREGLYTASLSKKGVYKCECGAKKYGEPSLDLV